MGGGSPGRSKLNDQGNRASVATDLSAVCGSQGAGDAGEEACRADVQMDRAHLVVEEAQKPGGRDTQLKCGHRGRLAVSLVGSGCVEEGVVLRGAQHIHLVRVHQSAQCVIVLSGHRWFLFLVLLTD